MNKVLVYGKEHTFLEKSTGLLFRNSGFKETAALHRHTFYEMFIAASGTALHLVNDAIKPVKKGDLVFIRPDDEHTYEFYCSDNFHIVNIGFSSVIFEKVRKFLGSCDMFEMLLQCELPKCVSLNKGEAKKVEDDFMQIGDYMKSGLHKRAVLYAQCCIARIFAEHFFRYDSCELSERKPEWLENMLIQMQKIDNLREGVPRMRELSCCSENHLCRVFKSVMSLTPTEYVNGKRLEYAIYLLTQTSDEIFDIAEQCGFYSLSHFYHEFKKKYNCSPAKFRKRMQL